MSTFLNRRRLVFGLAAMPALTVSSRSNAAIPWATVGVWMAQGATQYVGGQALSTLMRAGGYTEPGNRQILDAIDASVKELKAYFDYRLQVTIDENEIRKLNAQAAAVSDSLSRWATLQPAHRRDRRYRYILENLDVKTGEGLSLAEKFPPLGLPSFAIFTSARTMTMQSFFEIDRNRAMWRQWSDQLEAKTKFLIENSTSYLQDLHPSKRVSDISCSESNGGGGGFHVRTYNCQFTAEGHQRVWGGQSNNSDGDDHYRAQAAADRNNQIEAVKTFQNDAITKFGKPLREIGFEWFKTSRMRNRNINVAALKTEFDRLYPQIS